MGDFTRRDRPSGASSRSRWPLAFLAAAAGLGSGLALTHSYWMELVQRLTLR